MAPNLERASLRTILNQAEINSSTSEASALLTQPVEIGYPSLNSWRQPSITHSDYSDIRSESRSNRLSISNITESSNGSLTNLKSSSKIQKSLRSVSFSPDSDAGGSSPLDSSSSELYDDEGYSNENSITYEDLHSRLLDCIEYSVTQPEQQPGKLPSFMRTAADSANGVPNRSGLSHLDRVRLLRNFVDEVSISLDLCNNDHHFEIEIPRLALSNRALCYAILAISSKQFEQIDRHYPISVTLDIYWECVQYLIPELASKSLEAMAACVILCGLEIMCSSSHFRRRHVKACASLLSACNITGMTSGLGGAMFWCLARMDIATVVIGDESSTMRNHGGAITQDMSVNAISALFRSHWSSAQPSRACDSYANYALLLISRVIALVARDTNRAPDQPSGRLGYDGEWEELWDGLREWVERRPDHMLPLYAFDEEANEVAPFPAVLYGNSSASK